MHNMQPARISIWQARSALIPCYRPASRLPGFAMASSVSGSDVSQAHQAANQAGEEATRGTTPAKLQSAAAKGYSAEQTAQSLKDAPRANLDDPKVPSQVKAQADSAATNGSAGGATAGRSGAVTGSEVSAAHKASSQGGANGTEPGTLPSKLQSAAAKGRTPEQVAQSLNEAPKVDPNDPAIPQEVKAKMAKA